MAFSLVDVKSKPPTLTTVDTKSDTKVPPEIIYVETLLWFIDPVTKARLVKMFAVFFNGLVSGKKSGMYVVDKTQWVDKMVGLPLTISVSPFNVERYFNTNTVLMFLVNCINARRTDMAVLTDSYKAFMEEKLQKALIDKSKDFIAAAAIIRKFDTTNFTRLENLISILDKVAWSIAEEPIEAGVYDDEKGYKIGKHFDDEVYFGTLNLNVHTSRNDHSSGRMLTIIPDEGKIGVTVVQVLQAIYDFYNNTPLTEDDIAELESVKDNDMFGYIALTINNTKDGKEVKWIQLVGDAIAFEGITVNVLTGDAEMHYGS